MQMEEEFQRNRNKEFLKLQKQKKLENEKKKKYVAELMKQMKHKDKELLESKEEYMKDRTVVNDVVERIIQEEMK